MRVLQHSTHRHCHWKCAAIFLLQSIFAFSLAALINIAAPDAALDVGSANGWVMRGYVANTNPRVLLARVLQHTCFLLAMHTENMAFFFTPGQ